MLGRSDNIRFFLFKSGDPAMTRIPPLKDYEAGNKSVIERDDFGKYFATKKAGKVTFYREGYQYLREVNALLGVNADVRLIIQEKNNRSVGEEWITIDNVGVDLFSLDFDDREETCQADIVTGGLLELIEKRWDDEIDIMPNESLEGDALPALATQSLLLTPRQIFRRSRLEVEAGTLLEIPVSGGGSTARAIPFKLDYRSEDEVTEVVSTTMNSVGGNYATLQFSGATVILNAKQDTTYTFRGSVSVEVTSVVLGGGPITLDMVFFKDGGDLVYDRKVVLDTAAAVAGNTLTYTWSNEQILVRAGESVAIALLSDPGLGIFTEVEGSLFIEQDGTFRQTYTRAMRIGDLFDRVLARITGQTGLFTSIEFGPGGKWHDTLIAHGTWLRNVPEVINPGEDDEQAIQAQVSLKFLFEAISILEPMRYKTILQGLTELFYVGPERETQGNDTRVRIGQTRDSFVFTEVGNVVRKVIGDNYYGQIKIGSTKTGNDYGEVNNLLSICGNATWNTVNTRSDSVYEALSEVRTGAEDAELARSKQYEDNPGVDSDYDEDWFLFDAKAVGGEFHLKKWADHYATAPQNVYSVETNYNWAFTPARLLLNHGWKISSAWVQAAYAGSSLRFTASNCNRSLITTKSGEAALQEGQNIPHSRLDKATIYPMSIEFDHPVNQEIIEQLRDPLNLEGIVAFRTPDGIEYGRLISVNTNAEGKWQLVEAKLG